MGACLGAPSLEASLWRRHLWQTFAVELGALRALGLGARLRV